MSSDMVKRHIGTRQVESVGSSFPRVILIGCIFVEVLVSPERGPPSVSIAPMVLPFLCTDDSELDTEMPERHVSPIPHDAMRTRWRSRVASQSSSPTTSNPKIPTTPILPASSTVVAPSSEFPLVLVVPHSRFVDDDLFLSDPRMTFLLVNFTILILDSMVCEAYLRWMSAPLSTMYPPTTSESSAGDSSSESSAGPSHKRCRSPAATRFRDSISPEDSVEEDIDMDVLEDIKADATTIKVAVDRDVKAEVDAGIGMKVDVGIDVEDEVEEQVESSDRGTMERIEDIEMGQRELEARSLIAGGERASLLERVTSLERSNASLQGTVMMERREPIGFDDA
nr:hypothetical protein [Tanacetum cinerariifolium]